MLSYEQNMSLAEKVQSIKSAISLFDHVCTDGNYGKGYSYFVTGGVIKGDSPVVN